MNYSRTNQRHRWRRWPGLVLFSSALVGCDGAAPITASDPANSVDASIDDPDAVSDGSYSSSMDGGTPLPDASDVLMDATMAAIEGVRLLEMACPDGAGAIAGTECFVLEVECEGTTPITAQVRHTPPRGVERGTILAGPGGPGTFYYEDNEEGRILLDELAADGFRIVQRKWDGENGWFQGPGGLGTLSCRYAKLLEWVHRNIHTSGGFCATGNSAGAAELAYALTRWGGETLLDLVIPTGGPPFTRLDYGCQSTLGSSEWAEECAALLEDTSCDASCGYAPGARALIDHAYAPEATCSTQSEANAMALLLDSVLSPGADVSYPNTRVHFVFGDMDCDAARSHGLLFADAIETDVEITVAPRTSHNTYGTAEGAAAIRSAFDLGCVSGH